MLLRSYQLTVALLCALACLASACSRNPRHYIETGNKFFASGKFTDASLDYKKALQIDPNSGDAYYRLGLVSLRLGDTRQAVASLLRADKLLPRRSDVEVVAAEACIGAYSRDQHRPKDLYDNAVRLTGELLAGDPQSFDGLRLNGMIAVIDRKLPESIEDFRKANAVRPMQPAVIVELSQALDATNQPAEAESLLRSLIQKEPTFQPAYQLLYDQLMVRNMTEEAGVILKLRAERNPAAMDSWVDLARYYASQSRRSDLDAALNHILDDPKTFPTARLAAGAVYQSIGDQEKARHLFEAGSKDDKTNRLTYEKRIVNTLLAQRKTDEATQRLKSILASNPDDEESIRLDARLKQAAGNPDSAALAAAELQKLAEKHIGDEQLRFEAGRAWQLAGKPDNARAQFQRAATSRKDYLAPRLGLAQISIQTGHSDEALPYIDEILAHDGRNQAVRLLQIQALRLVGRTGEARATLRRLMTESPDSPELQLELGLVDIAEKRYSEAEGIFKRLYKPGQTDLRPLSGLAQIYAAEGQSAKSIQMLQAELRLTPARAELRQTLGRFAVGAGDFDVAIGQFTVLISAAPKDAGLQFEMGEAYRLKGEPSAAIPFLRRAVDLNPANAQAGISLATQLKAIGNVKDAEAEYRKIIASQPDNAQALNNLAYLLADVPASRDEALKDAQRAVERAPGNDRFQDTLGYVELRLKRTDSATQVFRQIVGKEPTDPTFRLHLAMAYVNGGKRDLARKELEAALHGRENQPSLESIREMLKGL